MMEENLHLQEDFHAILQNTQRVQVASLLLREELVVRPAAGTRGTLCTCWLSVVGRSRSCPARRGERDEPGRLL